MRIMKMWSKLRKEDLFQLAPAPKSAVLKIDAPVMTDEVRTIMMDMKKSYFSYKDHSITHNELYKLLSWMEDVISDSVKAGSVCCYLKTKNGIFNEQMKKDISKFCEHYGAKHQIKRAQTEIFELNDAILDYEKAKESEKTQNFDKLRDHVAEEFGDVLIMLYQIILSYGIEDEQIRNHMLRKIERQKKRIESGEAETI